jgi:ribosomal protein S6
MPLFETIVICKPGQARKTLNMLKAVGDSIIERGGNLRDISVLGDRVMARNLKADDTFRYHVGRYIQFVHDSHSDSLEPIEKAARTHPEALKAFTFRMNDFMSDALAFKRTARMTSPIVSQSERNAQFLVAIKEIKEKKQLNNIN